MIAKIFTGANGYYVAIEGEDGFHYQPDSSLGWDKKAAEALRTQMQADIQQSEDDRAAMRAMDRKYNWCPHCSSSHCDCGYLRVSHTARPTNTSQRPR